MPAQPRRRVGWHGHIRAAPRGWHGPDGADSVRQPQPWGVKTHTGGTGTPRGAGGAARTGSLEADFLIPISGLSKDNTGGAGCGSGHTPRIPAAGTWPGRCLPQELLGWCFPHPPPRRESGTQHPDKRELLAPVAQGHGLALLPWSSQGPCGADGAFGLPLSSLPQLGTCPRCTLLLPHPPPSLLGNLPSLSRGHPSSQLGKLRQEAKQTRLFPRGQWHPTPQTWVNPLTCSCGVNAGTPHPAGAKGSPCEGRAGAGTRCHCPRSQDPSLEALPAPRMNHTFPPGLRLQLLHPRGWTWHRSPGRSRTPAPSANTASDARDRRS